MLIEIHMIQNHAPSNLNRDDLGAPKTCYFGGVLRSRISSQCLKRSIRDCEEFKELLGGIRTRRLAELIAKELNEDPKTQKQIEKILDNCGIKSSSKKTKRSNEDDNNENDGSSKDSKMLVYTTYEAIREMAELFKNNLTDDVIAKKFAELIATKTAVPDMALTGRMFEPSGAGEVWKGLNKTVEASLQVAHAISTHETHPEIDYFVAADDVPSEDSGAGYLDEALFASSCFYKYFSINWEQLVKNLNSNIELAAHTLGAFLRGAATSSPTGKQNSYAAHNLPDGIFIEFRKSPISYANAFAEPVTKQSGRSIIEQSIAQFAQYVDDIKYGYGNSLASFWFSPNLRYKLNKDYSNNDISGCKSLDELNESMILALSNELNLNISWEDAKKAVVVENNRLI